MDTAELDYHLPGRLIAQHPPDQRPSSRLLVMDRSRVRLEHRYFYEVVEYLQPGDCLVINQTRVIPARFFLQRVTGGRIEGLFVKLTDEGRWQVLLKNASRLRPNETLTIVSPYRKDSQPNGPHVTVIENHQAGGWLLQPEFADTFLAVLNRYGITPLPPYIHRTPHPDTEPIDRRRYQTVYAKNLGSVAAPTAGLHFSEELLSAIRNKNINIARLVLHVGPGTFKPITTKKVEDHPMHAEFYQLDEKNAGIINQTLRQGLRIVAVGTTSVRTLETAAVSGLVRPASGWTRLFITPGFRFQITAAIITNFHLPRTSLLALVCAFAGTERILAAYRTAIEMRYRFYSFGDAMMII